MAEAAAPSRSFGGDMVRPIGMQQIIGLKRALIEAGIPVTVHMHDACGGQTFRLELTDAEAPREESLGRARTFAELYLGRHLTFDGTGATFWAAD